MSTSPASSRTQASPAAETAHVNAVTLRGRLAAEPEERDLPSGDLLLTFRLVVDRPASPGRQRRQVDTIDCAAWSGRVQRTVRSWNAGETVTVEGHLRRRFRRSDSGPTSRVEVEVTRGRRAR
ncbi:MAG TPA: single-stranded DNA-binding protein [Nocardioidaceae bacterium]|nr:single-stranded DNA-binding protein [Nocardioidaceae bacterium]